MKKRLPKKKKKFLSIRYTLYAIFFFLLLGIGWRTYQSFSKSVWDGKNRVNVVFASQPVLIASFSLDSTSLSLLLIPDKTYIETTHGYGQYRAEAIWGLGELENRPTLLAESCQEHLGLPIDGWIGGQRGEMILPPAGQGREEQIKETILGKLFQLIKERNQTNLTRWDLARLWWQIGKVRFDKIVLIDLKDSSALISSTLPDGSAGFEVDQNRLDRVINRYFQDKKIGEEALALEIVNATDHPGLAAQGVRIVANLGGRVIGVKDWDLKIDQCEIRSKKEKRGSYTLKKILKIFDCQFGGEDLGDSRAEAILILGENYWKKLRKK